MKPSVGRVVLLHTIDDQTHAAVIAAVHSDNLVNLAAFDRNGAAYPCKSVTLIQRAETPPEFSAWCEWPMPVDLPRAVVQLPVVEAPPAATADKAVETLVQAKGLNAPRITPSELQANIVDTEIVKHVSKSGQVLRWAVLTTHNGFAVAGKPSCSVSHENDDAEIGEKVAIDNAKSELWPLMGYELKSRLAA